MKGLGRVEGRETVKVSRGSAVVSSMSLSGTLRLAAVAEGLAGMLTTIWLLGAV